MPLSESELPRVQIPIVVETVNSTNLVEPVSGAEITITRRSDASVPTVFSGETGEGHYSHITTDSFGRIAGWVVEDQYLVSVTGGTPPIATTVVGYDATSGGGIHRILNGYVALNDLEEAVANALVPVGTILAFAGLAAPPRYLFCDGSEKLISEYSALATVCGSRFGTAASGKFKVPDLRGRAPVGGENFATAAGRLTTNNQVGQSGGAQTQALTTAQLASHSHGVTDPGHGHGISQSSHSHGVSDPGHSHGPPPGAQGFIAWSSVVTGKGISGGGGEEIYPGGSTTRTENDGTGIGVNGANANVSVNGGTTGISTNSAGTGEAHPNLQPYQACSFIIKY